MQWQIDEKKTLKIDMIDRENTEKAKLFIIINLKPRTLKQNYKTNLLQYATVKRSNKLKINLPQHIWYQSFTVNCTALVFNNRCIVLNFS